MRQDQAERKNNLKYFTALSFKLLLISGDYCY
jgi:hypothetical protein